METNTKKKNCWEFMKCGREHNSHETDSLGICPAATDARLHGVHGGINAGRACWMVAGTFCQGKVLGTSAKKLKNCICCGFHQTLRKQEGAKYRIVLDLMKELKRKRTDTVSDTHRKTK